jgi:hypothetical protein
MKGGEDELSEKAGATDVGCCVGDDSGELLASEERSEPLMYPSYSKVTGQLPCPGDIKDHDR